jgi:hypothetical protein
MVKESYHFAYFSNPADSVANIDRFIATINRIVPMGNEKSETIKNQALSAVRSSDILTLNDQFYNLAFNVEEHISLMGTNVIDVIRDNFDESEFAILYKAMDSERRWALHAYGVLLVLSKKESPELKGADKDVPNSKLYEHWLNQTFDYYNIRWD